MKRRNAGMTITRITKLWVRREEGVIGISPFAVTPIKGRIALSLTHDAVVRGHSQERVEVWLHPDTSFDAKVLHEVLDYINKFEDIDT